MILFSTLRTTKKELYPYSLEPVDLIVKQHLGVWQVDVAVIGIV